MPVRRIVDHLWREQSGSQSASAAAAALSAALIAGGLLGGARELAGPRVRQAFACAAAVLDGGAACKGNVATESAVLPESGKVLGGDPLGTGFTFSGAAPPGAQGWPLLTTQSSMPPECRQDPICTLAQQYAPTLRLHPEEELELCNATHAYQHATMTTSHPVTGAEVEVVPEGDGAWRTTDDGREGNSSIDRVSLDRDTDVRLIPPDGQDSPWCVDISSSTRPAPDPHVPDPHTNPEVYYHYDPATNSLTYWFFYCDDADHEGDWEGITLYFDQAGDVAWTCYSSHNEPFCVEGAPALDPLTGQPVVYASKGKHANRPAANYSPDPGEQDQWAAGGHEYDTRTMLTLADRQPWWGRNVRWGASLARGADFPFSCQPNSPRTPSTQGPIGRDEVPPPAER